MGQVDRESVWGRWQAPDSRKIFRDIDRDMVKDELLIDDAEEEHLQDGKSSLLDEFVFYIANPSFEVRLAAVRYFAQVLADTTTYTQYRWQKTLVARSLCAAYGLFTIQVDFILFLPAHT